MWAVIIGLLVLGLAVLLDRMGLVVLEEKNHFLLAIGIFFLIYIAAAIGVTHFTSVMAEGSGMIPLSAGRF